MDYSTCGEACGKGLGGGVITETRRDIDAHTAIHNRIARRRPAASRTRTGASRTWPGRPPLRAARLPRMDRRFDTSRHAHRSRGALDWKDEPICIADGRAATTDDGRNPRRSIRDDRSRRPWMRRDRRRDGAADRRTVHRGTHEHSLFLCCLLPRGTAVTASCTTSAEASRRQAGAGVARLQRALGTRCTTLERHVGLTTQFASRVTGTCSRT